MPALTPGRGRRPLLVVGLVLVAVVAAVGIGVYRARSVDVADSYEDIREQFKYGSIGSDSVKGIPYWIWLVLPTVFPEYLPDRPGDGYARMGFLYESPAHQRPIGISYRNYRSIPRVGVNCGACHTGLYRESVDSPATIVLGMPAVQMDLQSFFVFLFKAARDPRFEPDVLLPAIHAVNPSFSWFDDLVYRFLVIPTTRDALRKRADELSFAERVPREGPGRVDTFTSYKVHFGLPVEDVVGTADLPPLWNQRPRRGMALHWDGNNDRVEERNLSAAMGAGATEESLDLPSLTRMAEWDFDNLGFVSAGPEAERVGFRFDTRERGNGNQGHVYGTTLTATEIDGLLEFLKSQ